MILSRNKAGNKLAIFGDTPDEVGDDLRLVFKSKYDKQQYQEFMTHTAQGAWLVGNIDQDQIPDVGGNYSMEVHYSLAGLLALNEVREPLNSLDQPLNNLRGQAFDNLIKEILVQVEGLDNINIQQYSQTFNAVAYSQGEVTEVVYRSNNEDGKGLTYIKNNG